MKIALILIFLINFQSILTAKLQIIEFKSANFIGVEHKPTSKELNRAQAQQYCRSKYGTNLATILTQADQTEIVNNILPHFPGTTVNVYVGFRDYNGIKVWEPCNSGNCKSNSWGCSAHDETIASWHQNEKKFDKNKCGILKKKTGKWYDLACGLKRDFICNNPSGKYKTPPISCGAPPTKRPTKKPTKKPTKRPTNRPTNKPTNKPTPSPSKAPSKSPTNIPSLSPTELPSVNPSAFPTISPSKNPTMLAGEFYESDNYIGVAKRLNADNAFQFCYDYFGTGLAVITNKDDQMEFETKIMKQMYEETGSHVVHFGYRDYNGVAKWFVEGKCSAKDVLDEIWHSTATSPHKNQCGFINLSEKWSLHWDIGSCSLRRYFVCNNPNGKYKSPCAGQL